MKKPRRSRWIGLAAVASAGLLSGCYYYPYGYYWWGYSYPYPSGYPYAQTYPTGPTAAPPNPQPPAAGAPQPLSEPVQRAPLPPPLQ